MGGSVIVLPGSIQFCISRNIMLRSRIIFHSHLLPSHCIHDRLRATRRMATISSSLRHEQRTAKEPRESNHEFVILSHIRQVNDKVRLLRLHPTDPTRAIKFLPGQWLDTFIPGLPSAGGFTITSTPREAKPSNNSIPFLELAVQSSRNPPAQWLWQPVEHIIGTQLVVRVGGSFTWPPPDMDPRSIDRLVLVAGGVGINPLISIFSHLMSSSFRPKEVHFIYGTRSDSELDRQKILFLPRLMDLVAIAADPSVTLRLFLTGTGDEGAIEHGTLPNRTFARRIAEADLIEALDGYQKNFFGAEYDRSRTMAYVCGPPKMTDDFVNVLRKQPGMSEERVKCEKWW